MDEYVGLCFLDSRSTTVAWKKKKEFLKAHQKISATFITWGVLFWKCQVCGRSDSPKTCRIPCCCESAATIYWLLLLLRQNAICHVEQAGHKSGKPRILRDFSEHGKLRILWEFCAISRKNCNKQVFLVCHSKIFAQSAVLTCYIAGLDVEWPLMKVIIVSAYRYIATTNLPIIPVFVEYLRQFLIDIKQICRHSSVPKNAYPCIFSSFLAPAVSEHGAAATFFVMVCLSRCRESLDCLTLA